jgi:hypothetical protein
MSKKIKMVLAMVVMLGLAGSAQAYQLSWCISSGNWADPARWDVMPSPTLDGDALIYNGAVLDVTTPGQGASNCAIGYPQDGATVNVAAGIEWTVTNSLRVGYDYKASPPPSYIGTGVLNVYGTARSGGLRVSTSATSAGTINVYNGGTLKVGLGGWAINIGEGAPAAIYLKGNGSMEVEGDGNWNMNLNNGRGHIDIEAGQLKVLGDHRTELQSCVNNGWITSHGGYSPRCSLAVTLLGGYTYVKTTGCTCVTYLPADLNRDCYVDMRDIAMFAQGWMSCTNPADVNCVQ